MSGLLGSGAYSMFGKSLELLGMAGFNVFLGLTLTVTFLNQNGGKAAPNRLTEERVSMFVTEMTDVALGKNPELDQFAVTTWLMKHLDDDSLFLTNMNIAKPDGNETQEKLEMNRMDYISHVLKDNKAVKNREATLHIEYVKIEEGGKTALVVFTSREKASVPVSSDGHEYEIPISGTSYCEQKITMRDTVIKVSSANCTTNVRMAEGF